MMFPKSLWLFPKFIIFSTTLKRKQFVVRCGHRAPNMKYENTSNRTSFVAKNAEEYVKRPGINPTCCEISHRTKADLSFRQSNPRDDNEMTSQHERRGREMREKWKLPM